MSYEEIKCKVEGMDKQTQIDLACLGYITMARFSIKLADVLNKISKENKV